MHCCFGMLCPMLPFQTGWPSTPRAPRTPEKSGQPRNGCTSGLTYQRLMFRKASGELRSGQVVRGGGIEKFQTSSYFLVSV
mmetsp:Transcript_16738/g.28723  ORF Transcript_16738/g.28723 Transcript_16738/m.28723 type:complete len:81 (-) Transcript_16738:380-622(-)